MEHEVVSSTTLKYGDFELYQPKGYLPPSPLKANPSPTPQAKDSVTKAVAYKPAKGYLPPLEQSKIPETKESTASSSQDARTTSYTTSKIESSTLKPQIYKPSKGYLPPVEKPKKQKNKQKTVSSSARYTTPSVLLSASTSSPLDVSLSSTISRPKPKANQNLHPHTFFHDAQAEKVHKGKPATVYFNSLHVGHNKKTSIY